MIEMSHLKNVLIFIQTVLSLVLSRKLINIYKNISRKNGDFTVTDFQKYEKLEYKKNKLNLLYKFIKLKDNDLKCEAHFRCEENRNLQPTLLKRSKQSYFTSDFKYE